MTEYCPAGKLLSWVRLDLRTDLNEGTILDLMYTRERNKMSGSEILRIFKEICMCVAVLHSQEPPIAHRDLKVPSGVVLRCRLTKPPCRSRMYCKHGTERWSYAISVVPLPRCTIFPTDTALRPKTRLTKIRHSFTVLLRWLTSIGSKLLILKWTFGYLPFLYDFGH